MDIELSFGGLICFGRRRRGNVAVFYIDSSISRSDNHTCGQYDGGRLLCSAGKQRRILYLGFRSFASAAGLGGALDDEKNEVELTYVHYVWELEELVGLIA